MPYQYFIMPCKRFRLLPLLKKYPDLFGVLINKPYLCTRKIAIVSVLSFSFALFIGLLAQLVRATDS